MRSLHRYEVVPETGRDPSLRALALVSATLALILATLHSPSSASAATFIVDSTGDTVDASPGDGQCQDAGSNCTIRAAIMEANALAGADVVTIPAGTYTLDIPGANEDSAATGDIDILGSLTLNGEQDLGQPATLIVADLEDRVFDIFNSSQVVMSYVAITGGDLTPSGGGLSGGGGIRSQTGDLTLSNCKIFENLSLGRSGGIESGNSLTLFNTEVFENSGQTAGGIGGSGNFTVVSSAIRENNAAFGAGILNDGVLTLINSTVSGNVSSGVGGGIQNGMFGTTHLRNATVTSNQAASSGGGVANGITYARNSIIAYNSAPTGPDCSTSLTSQGYNWIEDPTDCTITGVITGNITGEDPLLEALGDWGGPTFTSPPTPPEPADPEDPESEPIPGSPVIDAGNPAVPGSGGNACEAVDQRGALRLLAGSKRCDMGAVEIWLNPCGNGLVEEEDDPPGCDAGSAVASIGTLGGTVESSDTSVSVSVPAGALDEQTTIIIAQNSAAKASGVVANLIDARPAGLTFTAPVTFTVRWDDRDNDGKIDGGICIADADENEGVDHGLPCDADADCGSGVCSVHFSNTLEGDIVLKRDGDRFGHNGFDAGPFRCADHQSGACSTAAPDCGDEPGTLDASMANCCDMANNTWIFQTCSFSEYLTGRREADMVPGKGSLANDCHSEWRPKNPYNRPYLDKGRGGQLGLLNFKQECTDGDPNCDSDKIANGTCLFEVQVSLSVNDQRLRNKREVQLCAPLQMQSWILVKPLPDSSKLIDQQNATELLNTVKALGPLTSTVGGEHGEILSFAPAVGTDCDDTTNCDTKKAKIQVPLAGANQNKKSVKVLKMRAITPSGAKDPDKLKLVCLPPPA